MTTNRILAYLAVVGVALFHLAGGVHFQSRSSLADIALSPGVLAAWLLLVTAMVAAILEGQSPTEGKASFWRCLGAFYTDFMSLFVTAFIPVCLLGLLFEYRSVPFLSTLSREASQPSDALFIKVALIALTITWFGLGLAFHQGITTPGSLAFNIQLEAQEASTRQLAVLGSLGYCSLVLPFVRRLTRGMDPVAKKRAH